MTWNFVFFVVAKLTAILIIIKSLKICSSILFYMI